MEAAADLGWWSVVPPVLAIALALATREVFVSLALGIWSGYLILAGGNPLTGTLDTIQAVVAVFQSAYNTKIVLFTLVVGSLIALMQAGGGVEGFVQAVLRWLRRKGEVADARGQRRRVELLAFATGILLFIESNISILTVGTLYRPVADELGVPREKMAYIADTGSAPSCMLIPFNAWGAFVAGLLAAQGVDEPFGLVLHSVLFNAYPAFALLLLLFVILSGRDIGPMKRAEARGTLLREGAVPMISDEVSSLPPEPGAAPRAALMVAPILVMLALVPAFIAYTGEGRGLARLESADGASAVLYAVTFAAILSLLLAKFTGAMGLRRGVDVAMTGMAGMLPLAILMVLAFAIGSLAGAMETGQFVADVSAGFLTPALLPALVFVISAFVAFSTGTSWGTFAIMIAIAVPLAQSVGSPLPLAVAAALGGGVFGDHASPISDTSVISSMAAGSDHIDHVRTQLPYALLAGGAAVLVYLVLGMAFA